MARLISTWEELNGLVSEDGKYTIEVDLHLCSGWIRPVNDISDEDYWKHHEYLSTHTFYGSQHKNYTKLLQNFGFDIEIANWDKEN